MVSYDYAAGKIMKHIRGTEHLLRRPPRKAGDRRPRTNLIENIQYKALCSDEEDKIQESSTNSDKEVKSSTEPVSATGH